MIYDIYLLLYSDLYDLYDLYNHALNGYFIYSVSKRLLFTIYTAPIVVISYIKNI